MNREKVIKGLEQCKEGGSCDGCEYDIQSSKCIFLLHADVLALLKEQEAQKFFVDESGKITPLPVVTRCKDCKYSSYCNMQEAFPCIKDVAKCTKTNIVHEADWFCADGERKEGR